MSTNRKDDLAQEWPKPQQFKRSIRLEFSLYVSAILIVLMAITGYVITNQYVETVTQNITEKLLVQARSYSGPAGKLIISTDEPDALLLNNICKKLTQDNPDVYWAGIAGKDNVYLAHSDLKQVIASGQMSPTESNQSGFGLREEEKFDLHNDTIFITVPIRENDLLLGKLRVASSVEPIKAAKRTSIISVASITIIVLLIGLPLTMIVLRRKLRPISEISDSLKKVDFADISLEIPITVKNEFGYLAQTLQVMGAKLNTAQREIVEKERISRELEIAREIQVSILPREYPKEASYEFAGTYRSAREVGGDYYEFIDIDENHLGFLVADVSGKSLPGMLVMLLTRDIVLRLARSNVQPADLLCSVNRELLGSIKKGMFVTMFYGILNRNSGEVMFASAGHNPLIKINGHTGQSELIKTKGYPLGMMPDGPFTKRIETGQILLSGEDWLIQYTDGVNEAQDSSGEEFGMDRFVRSVESQGAISPSDMVSKTLSQLEEFVGSAAQYDDITILAMKWNGKATDIERREKGAAISAS